MGFNVDQNHRTRYEQLSYRERQSPDGLGGTVLLGLLALLLHVGHQHESEQTREGEFIVTIRVGLAQ